MSESIRGTKKLRGRPKTTGSGIQLGLRWQLSELDAIDRWRGRQADLPSRSDAIRRLVECGPRSAAWQGYSRCSARHAAKKRHERCRRGRGGQGPRQLGRAMASAGSRTATRFRKMPLRPSRYERPSCATTAPTTNTSAARHAIKATTEPPRGQRCLLHR